jgi:hypothetical protein
VEVCITVAILALAAGVVIPGLNSLSRAELRKAARTLATMVRATYDDAALTGETYRMVFNVGKARQAPPGKGGVESPPKPAIEIQASQASLMYDDKAGAFVDAAAEVESLNSLGGPPGEDPDEAEKRRAAAQDKPSEPPKVSEAVGALFGINKLASRAAQAGFTPKGRVGLSDEVRVLDVWTEGMDQPVTDGEVYLMFFPHGYTQDAVIHLEDAERRVFTVRVSALTGRAQVEEGYVEVPK